MHQTPQAAFRAARRAVARAMFPVAFFSMFINALMLASPIYLMQLFDRVLVSRSVETLWMLTLLVVGAIGAMGLLELIRSRILVRVSRWIERQTAPEFLAAALRPSAERPNAAALRDLGVVRSFLTGPGALALLDAPWVPLFIAVTFAFHPLLGVVAGVGALSLVLLTLLNEAVTAAALRKSGALAAAAQAEAESGMRNADALRAMGMLPGLIARWRRLNDDAIELQVAASDRAGGFSAATKTARQIVQTALLAVGAWLATQNEISGGVMIAASIAMGRALAPIELMVGAWKSVVAARAAYVRLKKAAARLPDERPAMELPRPKGFLKAENVALGDPSGRPILRSVDFAVEPGEILAVVGPTAAGKSSLARLLVGAAAPSSGVVRLDSADIWDWAPEDRGRHVGYLPQEVELFRGTVRDNVARLGDAPSHMIVEAAQAAGVHDMILRLPKGYETEIGDGGAFLSGGQRQRIALARALFGNPRLLVLDEPNANLDEAGEGALAAALTRAAAGGAAVVVITHRPDILRVAHKLLQIQDGVGRLAVRAQSSGGAQTPLKTPVVAAVK